MRVALVSPYDFSVPGGVAEHVRNLAHHLSRIGHDVHVVAPATARGTTHSFKLHVATSRVISVQVNGSTARIVGSLRGAIQAFTAIRAINPDVAHVHEPAVPLLGPVAVLGAPGATVATFHAAQSAGWRPLPVVRHLLRALGRGIDRRIAVSSAAQRTAASYTQGAIEVVPNGVDVATFRRVTTPPPEMAGGRPTVLFLGRLDPRKGFATLVEALPSLRRRIPSVRLVVAGPFGTSDASAWANRCRRQGFDDVQFVGCVGEADRTAYLQHASVVCAPSIRGESHGVVLLEAMASGTPIVAAANDGYREVIHDGRNGMLVVPNDSGSLVAALGAVLEDAALRDRLREGGNLTAAAHDWPLIAQDIVRAYSEAFDGRLGRDR